MPINVANFFEADRRSAVAGEAIDQGMIIQMSHFDDVPGTRKAMRLGNGDVLFLVPGLYAVAYKVSNDPDQVASTTASTATGVRTVTIASSDAIVEVRPGAMIEYTADLLDDSLNPAEGGTTPIPGDALEIVGSKWCEIGTASAITAPLVGRVFRTFGTSVVVELLHTEGIVA